MTKPIEWRLPDKTETKTTPGKIVRLGVYVPAEGYLLNWAGPADLAAALAAMGEGERAEVLRPYRFTNTISSACAKVEMAEWRERAERADAMLNAAAASEREYWARLTDATARAEAAEREVERLRLDAAQRDRDWTVIRALTDAPYGHATTVAAVRRVVSERDSLLESVAAREKERDEARLETKKVEKAYDSVVTYRERFRRALVDVREAVGATPDDDTLDEVRRVVADRDDLRVKNDGLRDCLKERKTICEDAIKRAVAAECALSQRPDWYTTLGDRGKAWVDAQLAAAETAAAQREPREYPLAEGSPLPTIDPERLDLVRRALSGYVDTDQSPEQAARVAVEVADAALSVMRGLV